VKRDLQLVVAGQAVRAEVRESRRSRRLRLVVRPGRLLEVTVPRGTGSRALKRFLGEHEAWIADRLDEARDRAARSHTLGLCQPGSVVLAGRRIPVARMPGDRAVAALRNGVLEVSGPDPAAAIERWYRREARRLLETAAAREAARLGLSYSRIAVRDQRTRWGSCSTRSTLSFSWRLALAPPEVLDYVVVHELLHLREHNHSRAFWRLLDVHRPGWPAEADWLRIHGEELQAYTPGTSFRQ
jgi:predicted metal-dependent hydrolase